jgi:DNA topoisomerase VI subunit B
MDSKKRPISPGKDLEPKKLKTEQDDISCSTSPTLKTRTIKVIPPKSPLKLAEPSFKISVQQSVDNSLPVQKIVKMQDGKVSGEKVGLGLVQSTAKSPEVHLSQNPKVPVVGEKKVSVAVTSPDKPPSLVKPIDKITISKPTSTENPGLSNDQNGKKNDTKKATSVVDRAKKIAATLETMEFKSPRSEVLAMIQGAEKTRKGESIIAFQK